MKISVRAPATTANLGAGFDCAAVALDLWNEVVISDGGTPDRTHLGVQAFERIDPADGLRFEFFDRIPRERGFGSSAAVIALGLVAAAHVAGRDPDPEWLLAEGLRLEGHADNLAAALAGGACLTSAARIHRVADGVPAVPIALRCPSRFLSATPSSPSGAPRSSAQASPPTQRSSSLPRWTIASTSLTAPSTRRCWKWCATIFLRGRSAPRSRGRARP